MGTSFLFTVVAISLVLPSTLPAQEIRDSSFQDFNITLMVSDVRRSVEFYRTILEFKFESYTIGAAKVVKELAPSDPEPYAAMVVAGGQRINLLKSVDPPRPSGAQYLIHVTDPAAYYGRLVKRGVSVTLIATEAGQPFWFSVLDPDGHWFMFMGLAKRQ
jgi:predicted enzyme related to lactoylglutathione lyase